MAVWETRKLCLKDLKRQPTTLHDVVLAAVIHHRLVVSQAAQAHPAGSAFDVSGCTGAGLALGDCGQTAIAV